MGLNAKAMNAIFSAVDMNVFKLISTCDKAKDAWDILQTTFEGTSSVRVSRMQLLTTRFENLRMNEGEKLADFNAKICDIASESFALGDAISEEKLVRKVLRSLPKRFAYKVTANEEANDVSKMKLQELMGSLRTFEMGLTNEETVQKKSIAFQAGSSSDVPNTVSDKNDLTESIALLAKNISKFIKRYEKSPQNNFVKNRFSKPRRTKDEDSIKEKHKEVKCRECGGLGHFQAECANTLKKKNKSYSSTLSESDDPDDSGSDEECVSNYIAFMTHSLNESVPTSVSDRQNDNVLESSDDEEFTEETAIEAYKKLHESWTMNNLQQSRNNSHSQNGELLHLKKLVKMMNSGSSQLDDILSKGKSPQDHTRLGYTGGKFFDRFCQGQTSRMHDESVPEPEFKSEIKQPQPQKSQPRKIGVVCHYCEKPGHIRPYYRFEEVTRSVPVSVPNRSEDCNRIESISESNDALKNHSVVDDLEEPAAQIDDESFDGTLHVPTSVLGKASTICSSYFLTAMASEPLSFSPSFFFPKACRVDLIREVIPNFERLLEKFKNHLCSLYLFPLPSFPAVMLCLKSAEVPASVPCDAPEVSATLSESVSATVPEPSSQSRVVDVRSSSPVVKPASLESRIASATCLDPSSLEESAASIDALIFVSVPASVTDVIAYVYTPVVIIQVSLGEASPKASDVDAPTLAQAEEGRIEVDDIKEDDIAVEENASSSDAESVPPLLEQGGTSSKFRGVKRKLQLLDEPEESPSASEHHGDSADAKQNSDKDEIHISIADPSKVQPDVEETGVMELLYDLRLDKYVYAAPLLIVVATCHRVTRSQSEQMLGLISGIRRPLMKKARVPSPSDDDTENVP
ncbi:hypothetical protein C2S51_038287 [Perilla frutescens var. frutescens]|nr:hypothetical protein C2S51_038287 [Perilla frutescens var. frutescens]